MKVALCVLGFFVLAGSAFAQSSRRLSGKVTDADGKPLVLENGTLDPERLPLQLKEWAHQLKEKGKLDPAPKVVLSLRRHRHGGGANYEDKEIELKWDNSWAFDHVIPITLAQL